MKKKILLLVGLLMPVSVFAAVDGNTNSVGSAIADNAEIKTICQNAEKENAGYTSATNGYYLECIAVKCENGKNVHYIDNSFDNKVVCANGNKNPLKEITSSGADKLASSQTVTLAKDASCAPDTNKLDASTGAYAFATRIYSYNCAYNTDGTAFVSNDNKDDTNTTTTTTTIAASNTTKDDNKNPQTGVEDYYKILIPAIIVISGALYLVNKKNVFKKI